MKFLILNKVPHRQKKKVILLRVHQTHDRKNVYPVAIISYPCPVLYHIMSLSYHVHQTS